LSCENLVKSLVRSVVPPAVPSVVHSEDFPSAWRVKNSAWLPRGTISVGEESRVSVLMSATSWTDSSVRDSNTSAACFEAVEFMDVLLGEHRQPIEMIRNLTKGLNRFLDESLMY